MSALNDDRGQNKRRRTDSRSAAAREVDQEGGGFAASNENVTDSSSLTSKLGPHLEETAAILATLPTEFQDLLIPDLKGMLSLIATIKQREETLKKYDQPMLDPKTKNPLKQLSNSELDLPYILSSLQKAMPLKCSDNLKDDTDMKNLMDKAACDWELYAKIKMAAYDKIIKQLEISKRQEKLKGKFLDFVVLWTTGLVLGARAIDELPAEKKLDHNVFGQFIAFDAIKDLQIETLKTLGYQDARSFKMEFCAKFKDLRCNDILQALASCATTRCEVEFGQLNSKKMTLQLSTIIPNCWTKINEKDKTRKVNAAI